MPLILDIIEDLKQRLQSIIVDIAEKNDLKIVNFTFNTDNPYDITEFTVVAHDEDEHEIYPFYFRFSKKICGVALTRKQMDDIEQHPNDKFYKFAIGVLCRDERITGLEKQSKYFIPGLI